MIGETGPEQSDRQLLSWIERRGGTTTVRELTHGIRGYRGNAEKAQEDLEKLVEARRLVGVHVPPSRQGGRPRFEYQLARVAKSRAYPSASAGSGTGDSGDTGGDASAAAAPEDEWGSL
jgi:hypothetical protein